MLNEEAIVERLCEKFDYLKGNISVQRSKRIFTNFLDKENFEPVLRYLHDEMGFYKAHHVVGTDEGADLGLIYLLSNADGIIIALKEKAPKADPKVNSLTGIYPSLELHERELVDLFGVQVEGLPEGPSYPLPDGWPKGSYPMRKDWNPNYFDKNTMTYNVPSENPDKKDGKQ